MTLPEEDMVFKIKQTGQLIEAKKSEIAIKNRLDFSLFPIRLCSKCDKPILERKTSRIVFNEDLTIDVIVNLDYGNHLCVFCLSCKNVELKGLNTNSLEYNMKKFGYSEDQARQLIYSRNKSPFYKTSHKDPEDYRKFQSHDSFSPERKKEIQDKQDASRKKYHDEILITYGKEGMSRIKDSSSLQFFINKYGDALGRQKFKEKGEKTRGFRLSDVMTTDEKKLYLSTYYSILTEDDLKAWFEKSTKEKSVLSILYLLNTKKLSKKTVPLIFGKEVFSIPNMFEFLGVEESRVFVEKRVLGNDRGWVYSGMVDGHFFRSGAEISFYIDLSMNGISVVDTNKKYPDSTNKEYYDFCLQLGDYRYYVELIGRNDEKYKEKLLHRSIKYKAILLERKFINKFIADCKRGKLDGSYNDWEHS